MDDEVASLKKAADIQKTTKIAEMEFCEGTLGGRNVVIVKCGMGKVNAGICAHTLINDFDCTKIINTGVAGSLDSKIDIGDIVVSTEAVQHDFDVEAIGFQRVRSHTPGWSHSLRMRRFDLLRLKRYKSPLLIFMCLRAECAPATSSSLQKSKRIR